ncbi:hypothetical protein GF373_08975 [bacterium]|nr:hypothetical protein [bacterium]
MPGGDRTGPMGMGPMTGRAAGYCAGYPTPGYTNPAPRRGGGRGFGGGRGYGRGMANRFGWGRGWGTNPYYPPQPAPAYSQPLAPNPAPELTKEQEIADLKAQAQQYGQVLESIQKRIQELESEPKE